MAGISGIEETQLRRWLSLLRRPDQLSGPDVVELLTAHGRLPTSTSSSAIGHAAATLLVDSIEQLRAPEEAPREQRLPHAVLKTCFVEGAKLFQAAGLLGLSERQMSRERSRAIALLREELEGPLKAPAFRGEPIPTIRGFLPRPGQTHALQAVLEGARHANVFGPMGIGKTSLGAEVAAEVARHTPVIWYRMRPQVNTTLMALLFELGERLKQEGAGELSGFLNESLAAVDATLATRVALRTLAVGPILIVLDDYHFAEDDPAIAGFLEEGVARLPQLRLITISRYRYVGTSGEAFEVPPFSRRETSEFLKQLGVDCQPAMAKTIHTWTGGTPHLIKLAASWLKTASSEEIARGVMSLNEQEEVQSFLLSYTTQLLGPDDREVLEAASIFRDRFSDEALAFVSGRTTGEIVDASLRLSRVYVATRSREGDTAFFHTSVRDYVYARIEALRRGQLHDRAATWHRRAGRHEEADYHQHRAELALDDLDYSA